MRYHSTNRGSSDFVFSATPEQIATFDDNQVLALICCHHEEALSVLYERYGRLVFIVALRITHDWQTAEEVTQDVFQSVWQTAESFRPDYGRFTTWLISVARHRAIDTIRSRYERARVREQALSQILLADAATDDLEGYAEHTALREAMHTALASLPATQRQAIELAYYGGFTRVEIAERLGEPVGTIKTRLRLGLDKLRDLLHPL